MPAKRNEKLNNDIAEWRKDMAHGSKIRQKRANIYISKLILVLKQCAPSIHSAYCGVLEWDFIKGYCFFLFLSNGESFVANIVITQQYKCIVLPGSRYIAPVYQKGIFFATHGNFVFAFRVL